MADLPFSPLLMNPLPEKTASLQSFWQVVPENCFMLSYGSFAPGSLEVPAGMGYDGTTFSSKLIAYTVLRARSTGQLISKGRRL